MGCREEPGFGGGHRHNVHPIAAAIGVRSYEIIDDSAGIRKKLEETPGTVQLSAF